jgi:hypothetical protein
MNGRTKDSGKSQNLLSSDALLCIFVDCGLEVSSWEYQQDIAVD